LTAAATPAAKISMDVPETTDPANKSFL